MAGKDATLQSMPGNPTVASGAVRCEGNLTENVEKQSNVKDLRRSLRIILRGTILETLSFYDCPLYFRLCFFFVFKRVFPCTGDFEILQTFPLF